MRHLVKANGSTKQLKAKGNKSKRFEIGGKEFEKTLYRELKIDL